MLTKREKALLEFEEQWIDRPFARREMAVQRVFGIRHTQYQQALNRLLDREDAIAANPQLLYRLRARRERRLNARDSRLLMAAGREVRPYAAVGYTVGCTKHLPGM